MKRLGYIILLVLSGCQPAADPLQVSISEARQAWARDLVAQNQKTIAWAQLTDSIYRIADTNGPGAIAAVDYISGSNKQLDEVQRTELHFIKGNIYERSDSTDQALKEYTAALNEDSMSPKYLAARAAVLISQHHMNLAFNDLSKATAVNYDYYWLVGNYYEIVGLRDSALARYKWLYLQDTTIYAGCKQRIVALSRHKPVFLKKLIIKPQDKRIMLLSPIK